MAEPRDSSGHLVSGENVRWQSSDTSIATVDSLGNLQARAIGETEIRAWIRGIYGRTRVRANPVPVASVQITPSQSTVLVGQDQRLTVALLSSFGRPLVGRVVTWETSNASIATVSAAGLVRGLAAGRATITARSEGRPDVAIIDVVANSLRSLSVNPATVALSPWASVQFAASALWSNGSSAAPSLTWSRLGAGTVTSSGAYTAPMTPGTYRVIAAHTGGTLRDTAVVTVAVTTASLTRLTISPRNANLATGANQQFAATALWSDGSTTVPPLSWSRLGAGTVTSSGRYTAPSTAGPNRVVVAHAGGTLRDTATVVVTAPPAATVTSFVVSPGSPRVQRGATVTFSTATLWSDGVSRAVTVSYQSTGGTMAGAVYRAGQVAGTFALIAACSCGAADSASVIVEPPMLSSIAVTPATVTLQTGASHSFTASALWSDQSTTLPPVTFSATGGTINATSGAYTAPASAGSYLVVLSQNGGTLRDTSVVTVQAVAPPQNSFTENMPSGAGLSLAVASTFGGLQNQVLNADGLAYNWDGRNAIDNLAPYGPNVFETFYAGNDDGNGDGGASLYGANNRGWRRFYFALSVWVPANYVLHNTGGEKFFYPLVRADGNVVSSTMFNWHLMGSETSYGSTWSLYVDPQIGGSRVYQNYNARPSKGSYQKIEVYAVMNTPGQPNGIWRAWVNGQLAADFSNILYSNAATQATFDGIRFEGTRGGPAATIMTPPGGQVRRYNRLAFYGATN